MEYVKPSVPNNLLFAKNFESNDDGSDCGGKWFTGGVQFADTEHFLDSVNIRNKTIVEGIYVPNYDTYKNQWHSDAEMQRHYWAATFLLPIGSIFILAVVVLLMVLFKRCPYMVAAIVAGILGIIIIFATLVSLNHTPIYS